LPLDGLDAADPAHSASFPRVLAMPFEPKDEAAIPDTKVRDGARVAR